MTRVKCAVKYSAPTLARARRVGVKNHHGVNACVNVSVFGVLFSDCVCPGSPGAFCMYPIPTSPVEAIYPYPVCPGSPRCL